MLLAGSDACLHPMMSSFCGLYHAGWDVPILSDASILALILVFPVREQSGSASQHGFGAAGSRGATQNTGHL